MILFADHFTVFIEPQEFSVRFGFKPRLQIASWKINLRSLPTIDFFIVVGRIFKKFLLRNQFDKLINLLMLALLEIAKELHEVRGGVNFVVVVVFDEDFVVDLVSEARLLNSKFLDKLTSSLV